MVELQALPTVASASVEADSDGAASAGKEKTPEGENGKGSEGDGPSRTPSTLNVSTIGGELQVSRRQFASVNFPPRGCVSHRAIGMKSNSALHLTPCLAVCLPAVDFI